jgi:hypothetical protein
MAPSLVEKFAGDVHVGPRGTLELLSQREVEAAHQQRPGAAAPGPVPALRPGSSQHRQRDRRRRGDLRGLQRLLRRGGQAHPWAQADHPQRPGQCLRRGPDGRGHPPAPVRGAARHRLRIGTEIATATPSTRHLGGHHRRGVPDPQARAGARSQPGAEPGGVLGRSFHPGGPSTNTPRRWATSSACAGSTSAPAAARGR